MKKNFTLLATSSLILALGTSTSVAQDDDQSDAANPVELYACNYNEGKGPSDLDAVNKKWNSWADKRDLTDYSAWTLVPFYSSPEQEFDFLWLGVSPSAKAMGRGQDEWLAEGGKIAAEYDEVGPCNVHVNFAAVEVKAPPEREDPSNIVIAFSDCNISDGVSFGDDIAPALGEWGEYRASHGSTAGIWVFFPVYGGGGEEFDFKYISAYQNLEDQGADWDQYSAEGRFKARELFAGKVSCDSQRVYIATNVRRAEDDED